MWLVINKALNHSQRNLNWRLWPHLRACHMIRMKISNNPFYLCLWPKAPWMRVVGLPSLPPRYALTRFKQVEEETRYICSFFHTSTGWCWLMLMLTDWQPGRLELLLWKTSIQSTGKTYFLTKKSFHQNINHAHQHSTDRACKKRKVGSTIDLFYMNTTFNRVVAAVVVVGQKPWLRISGNCYSTRQDLDRILWTAIIAKKCW